MNPISPYRVVIYCPDRHIQYDGNSPYEHGVGGGISVRIRMAQALQRAGNRLTVIGNVGREAEIRGVRYLPLESARTIACDVLIATTSGDQLDLSPLSQLETKARLTIVWVHGIDRPGGISESSQEFIYCVSNFIANRVRSEWELPDSNLFVSYNPFEEQLFQTAELNGFTKDPFRLIYFSHPSKGLQPALEVLRILRGRDPRYHLELYGGNRLWGAEEQQVQDEPGVTDFGLVGQAELAGRLLASSFCLNLQQRLEPGALVTFESMRAGCIILASPVGCYPEYIQNGRDGLLIRGAPDDPAMHLRAANAIQTLTEQPAQAEYIRRNARGILWNADTVAKTWMDHWRWFFQDADASMLHPAGNGGGCQVCAGPLLGLTDGYHCVQCGHYQRDLSVISENERGDEVNSERQGILEENRGWN